MPDHDLQEPPAELAWKPNAPGAPDVLLWSELAYHGSPVDSSRSKQASFPGNSAILASPTIGQANPRLPRSEKALENLCRRFAVPLVVGYTRTDRVAASQERYNSVAFVDPNHGFQGSYDKIGLVPWTEFTPLEGLTSRKGSRFSHGAAYPVFTLHRSSAKQTFRFATAICYDIAFPHLFRRYMRAAEGVPDFFLVCSSEHSDSTGRMSRHVLSMAKVRAIECRRTIVRNVDRGHSGRIDSTGRLRDESIPLLVESPMPLRAVPIDNRSTLYVIWGDWIPAAIVSVLLVAAALKICSGAMMCRSKQQ